MESQPQNPEFRINSETFTHEYIRNKVNKNILSDFSLNMDKIIS